MAAKNKPGPHTEHPKDTMFRVRMDKITLKELEESAEALATTRSDIIRRGIHEIHEGLKKK